MKFCGMMHDKGIESGTTIKDDGFVDGGVVGFTTWGEGAEGLLCDCGDFLNDGLGFQQLGSEMRSEGEVGVEDDSEVPNLGCSGDTVIMDSDGGV